MHLYSLYKQTSEWLQFNACDVLRNNEIFSSYVYLIKQHLPHSVIWFENFNIFFDIIIILWNSENIMFTCFLNRTHMLHTHNMALNRAFFYSLIYQRLNHSWDFSTQPGLMYIYMSATADVTASPGFVNGSGLFFDTNCSYPNW